MDLVLFGRLFVRERKARAAPSTGGRLVYAVGDVHGRLDLLEPLVADILRDAAASSGRPLIVFLGDYVDRGPDARGVVDLVLRLQGEAGVEVAALKGNHEEALLQFLDDPVVAPVWMEFGGAATLFSYGVAPPLGTADGEAWADVRDAFAAALPDAHLRFYQELELMRVAGDYAFVHAGVRPGAPLAAQAERDLLWIRHEFLDHRAPFEKVIVHGHTPTHEAELLPNRLGVDTGAYATGVLTAVRLCGEAQTLMQARAPR